MKLIHEQNAAEYLRENGRVPSESAIHVRELSGGVSNLVLRVDVEGEAPIVLKQSREQLRTKAAWFSRLDRIWVETQAMTLLDAILPAQSVPKILFEDRANYLYGMTCAPDESVSWKSQLLSGTIDLEVGRKVGEILGNVHKATLDHPVLSQFADREIIDQLRFDPYYRRVAEVHPDLAKQLSDLIDSTKTPRLRTLVLGDYSPKNIMVHSKGVVVLDFETAHAGDPTFDMGFLLSHLLLKAFRASPNSGPFITLINTVRDAYQLQLPIEQDLVRRINRHTSACVLARIDGKSPVDYRGDLDVEAVRRFARECIQCDPIDWSDYCEIATRERLLAIA